MRDLRQQPPTGLIFVNRFYWPEEPATSQLLTDLAEGLAAKGQKVSVITSRPADQRVPSRELHRGVSIIRIGSSRLGRGSLIGRTIDFLTFIMGTSVQLCTHAKRGDRVIFLTDPPLLATLLWPILALRRIAFYHWIQDIYPEIAAELTHNRWLNLFRPLRNLSWRRAQQCVTLGADMAGVLTQAGVSPDRIKLFPNWAPKGLHANTADGEIETLKSQWGISGKFTAVYSGNLGRVHNLSPIIDIAEQLKSDPDIAILFIGHGAQVATLQTEITKRGLRNVHFLPPQPRAMLNLTLAVADVHFVTLRSGCEAYVYPSKLYGISAVARPVVFIGPVKSALAETIRNEGLGYAFSPDDIAGPSSTLAALKASPERQREHHKAMIRFSQTHDFRHALQSWSQLLAAESGLATK